MYTVHVVVVRNGFRSDEILPIFLEKIVCCSTVGVCVCVCAEKDIDLVGNGLVYCGEHPILNFHVPF